MASAPSDIPPSSGRIDRDGRLVSADPPLAALQAAAGSALGRPLALPQLAALVRSAQSLKVPLSRTILVADDSHDLDLWVRAEPDEEGVTLTIERGSRRAPAPARLELISRYDSASDEVEAEAAANALEWAVDGDLIVRELAPGLLAQLELDPARALGQPLTRLFRLVEEDDGQMPLLRALAAREDFVEQRAQSRGAGGELRLSGSATFDSDGKFAGFRGRADGGTSVAVAPVDDGAMLDDALDEALRSPLDRIIDAADQIVERQDGPLRSDYANYASDIAAAGRHLLSVIRAMGEGSTSEQGPVDVIAAVAEASQLVKADADRREVAIEHDRPGEELRVRGEVRGIVQILVNILGNAIRHSPRHGTVAVVFGRVGSRIAITVADQGPGIAKPDQQRIFERYEQAGPAELAAGGTGLGLAISRRLARSMDGDISLETAPGEGARFTLSLPAA